MKDDRFEWDNRKAASNLRKHKIGFDVAREAFDANRFIDKADDDPVEDRSLRVAEVQGRLITVVYTERGHRIRIISVRKATPQERKDYGEQG